MALKDLTKAYIVPTAGTLKNQRVEVLFNPTEYSIEKSNQFQNTVMPGLNSPIKQFISGNEDTLTMELFFDTYTYHNGSDVREYTDRLARLLDIDAELHAPPVCQFVWDKVLFTAVIERISQRFTMFQKDGIPVQARVNVTFKQYQPLAEQLKEPPRHSPDRTRRVVVNEGDTLWLYAANFYDDPALWREIARRNGIANPRNLTVGQELIIPALE